MKRFLPILFVTIVSSLFTSGSLWSAEAKLTEDQKEQLLWTAADENNLQEVVRLLNSGIRNVDFVDPYLKITPLMASIWKFPDEKVVNALIAAGADVNFVAEDGETPLLLAVYEENPRIVSILLASGADPSLGEVGGKGVWNYAEEVSNSKTGIEIREMIQQAIGARRQKEKDKLEKASLPVVIKDLISSFLHSLTQGAAQEGE